MVAAVAIAGPAHAFDTKGHAVIEALAYRTIVEGHGMPARPEVLRDLINDGALDTPWCFGRGTPPEGECLDARADNPLLYWPQPESDRPDLFFRRQFSDAGQCFHYMGTLADAVSEPLPGTEIPRALAIDAVVRCNDLLDHLLRQIVLVGGPGTRRGGFGLYELMHAIEDSFSMAHAERTGDRIAYLRVWKPIERLAGVPSGRSKKIPKDAYHRWADERDKAFVVADGLGCEMRTDQPYDVPYECLSPEGDRAREAVVELLLLVRELRRAQLAAPAGADTHPENSEAWRAYKARWFRAVHPCEGAECDIRQPEETAPGRYAYVGADLRFQSPKTFEAVARGSVLRFSEDLNPFVYALFASLGYQYRDVGGSFAIAGLGLELVLPLGLRGALGLTPAELRVLYGSSGGDFQFLTRLLRFEYSLRGGWTLSVEAPLAVNWVEPSAHWSVGVGFSYGLSSRRVVTGDTLIQHQDRTERTDAEWVPPPAPYGTLRGRRLTVGVLAGITPITRPAGALEGENYGLGMLGAELTWDRDRWGRRYPFTPAALFSAGVRRTTGDSGYFTASAGLGVRWYLLGPLGLTLTPVRVEGGPKIGGKGQSDPTTGVHGEHYLLAGSRAGFALRLGVVDLLLDSPTIAWSSKPFGANEILSFTLGARL